MKRSRKEEVPPKGFQSPGTMVPLLRQARKDISVGMITQYARLDLQPDRAHEQKKQHN